MQNVKIDLTKKTGKAIKAMHATNNGPSHSVRGFDFFEDFKEAGIPYIRNHDAAICETYGSCHIVDVLNIFTDFSKDENDPANYDFEMTDRYVQSNLDAGSKVLYRLGSRIEHTKVKYQTKVPTDFAKYARICEHIIRHLCYGWADGHEYDIPYFEIWNEPDCENPDGSNPCWQGTQEQFREFYKVMSLHLKSCFPDKKIGGPAFTHVLDHQVVVDFVEYCAANQLPMDFFSWHGYETDVRKYAEASEYARKLLDDNGYKDAELILNEWNYVCGWLGEDMLYSYRTMANNKGAAFCAGSMLAVQKSPLDMFMYYDLRPGCNYNGLFDREMSRRAPYYSFWQFNKLYQLKNELATEAEAPIYVGAAGDGTKAAVQLTYYQDKDARDDVVRVEIKGAKAGSCCKIYLTDSSNMNELVREEIMSGNECALYLKAKPYDLFFMTIE